METIKLLQQRANLNNLINEVWDEPKLRVGHLNCVVGPKEPLATPTARPSSY